MAGETGLTGGSAEFPVFKSSEGAFDRAKYKEQEKAMVETDGVTARLTGKEIDEDLKKKKVSAEDAAKKANKFYDDSYDRNLKEIDPAIIRSGVYYDNAYSDAQSDKTQIKRRIDKGEALDGKEIFEMSKDAAKNKIGNINKLKTGKVTEIVQNLGLAEIKKFDLYEDVKSDFDSKIKDDKLKFDPMLSKIGKLLSAFNDKGPNLSGENSSKLYTAENSAALSAIAKILESEGFTNDSVVNMSKAYTENLQKLLEKTSEKKFESVKSEETKNKEEEDKKTKTTTEEQKIEEKKEKINTEAPTGTTKSEGSEIPNTSVKEPSQIESTKATQGSLEIKNSEESKKEPEVKKVEEKLENKKEENKQESNKEPITTGSDETDKMVSDITGIDLSKINKKSTGEGTSEKSSEVKKVDGKLEDKKTETKKEETSKVDTGSTSLTTSTVASSGTSGEKITTGHPEIDKMLGSILPTSKKSASLETEKKIEETKLGEKSTNTEKSETLKSSTPIKETTTQNLSSVVTPEKEKEEGKKEEEKTTSPSTILTNENSNKADTEPKKQSESESTETKTKTEEPSKANEEMGKDLKSMISLLSQLNNTLRNPLIVIPSDKKFH